MHTGWLLFGWNAAVFLLYGADKYLARAHLWRVRERTLLLCSFCLGAAGALLGMLVFRHKTKRWKFRVLVPLSLALQVYLLPTVWEWLQAYL